MKILIIDDEEIMRVSVQNALADAGHEAIACGTAEEGLAHLAEERFDSAVVDLKMPGMGGIEFLREAGGRFPETPVVLMTALGEVGETDAAFQYGAYGYLQKPIKAEALLAGIRRLEERLMEENC